MLIFLIPFFYHNRIVKFKLKTISGQEKKITLQINLNKINLLLKFLTDLKMFEINRSKVDINKEKDRKKKKKPRIRDQWQFIQRNSYESSITNNLYIREKNWTIWQKNYSQNAKKMNVMGFVSTICLFGILYLFALHISYADNPIIWDIVIFIFGITFLVGLVFAFNTPEMHDKAEFL